MKARTESEIKAAVQRLWPAMDLTDTSYYAHGNCGITRTDDFIDLSITAISGLGLRFEHIDALAEFFDTMKVEVEEEIYSGGCDTCGYGHRRGISLRISEGLPYIAGLASEPRWLLEPKDKYNDALIEAAAKGRVEHVGLLLDHGADIHYRSNSAILEAAKHGHVHVVEFLLTHDPGLLAKECDNALQAAAVNGQAEMVTWLIDRGADPCRAYWRGILDGAAMGGHRGVLEVLLGRDPTLIDLPDGRGKTALMGASGGGHPELVAWLLTRGADPTRRDDSGGRALDYATLRRHRSVVEVLLARDPSLAKLPGLHGLMSSMIALAGGSAELAEWLRLQGAEPEGHEAGAEALHWAAEEGYGHIVDAVLDRHPNLIDLTTRDSQTALMLAAVNGHAEMVRLLLSRGADPRRRMPNGARAFDCALERDYYERNRAAAEALLANDPSLIDLPGLHERTALISATKHRCTALVAWLLDHGSDAARKDEKGLRTLDHAIRASDMGTVELLIGRDRASLDSPGLKEATPLMAAVRQGSLATVSSLLRLGANPRHRRADGTGAVDLAAFYGRKKILELLLEHDPTLIDLPGRGGRTALMVACGRGHDRLAAWLLDRAADPTLRASDGMRAFDAAALNGQRSAMAILREGNPDLIDRLGFRELTALMIAAGAGMARR